MIRQNGGLSQPDQIKINLSFYSHSSFLFPLGGLDFILKTQELKGWEHGKTVMTLTLMFAHALQRNKWEYCL